MAMWTFRLLGFRVVVQSGFAILAGLFALLALQGGAGLVEAMMWPLVVFGSILVHELGHALTAQRLGLAVGDIELHMMGGEVTHARTQPARQLLISLAGPLAGLALGFAALALSRVVPDSSVLSVLVFVNIGWSIFNLLPVLPLDGGNALRAAIGLGTRESVALRITAGVGLLLASLGLAYALTAGRWWLTFLFGMFLWNNLQIFQQVRRL
jgi:Zn-dependent protease